MYLQNEQEISTQFRVRLFTFQTPTNLRELMDASWHACLEMKQHANTETGKNVTKIFQHHSRNLPCEAMWPFQRLIRGNVEPLIYLAVTEINNKTWCFQEQNSTYQILTRLLISLLEESSAFEASFDLFPSTAERNFIDTCSRTTSPHWLKTFLLSCPCADWPNDMRHSIFLSDDITQVSANFKSKNIFFLRNVVQCFNRPHLLLGDPDVVRNTCLFRIKSLQCRHVLMGLGKCPGDSWSAPNTRGS